MVYTTYCKIIMPEEKEYSKTQSDHLYFHTIFQPVTTFDITLNLPQAHFGSVTRSVEIE